MSNLFDDDDIDPVIPPAPLTITEPSYRGVTVDTRFIPSAALLTHVEGYAWTIKYFSQVIDKSNNLEGQQVTRKANFQQYIAVNKLEIKVQQPLTETQNATDKSLEVVGTAILPPNIIIPNEGDMFLGDAGDGEEYVFQVMSSRRLSMFKQSVHEIEYKLVDHSTDVRRYDLDQKTVNTVYYHKDFRYHGQNPLLQTDEHHAVLSIQELHRSITLRWWREFFSRDFSTLVLPAQENPIYDPFFTRFCRAAFTTTDAPEIQKLRVLNGYGDDNFVSLTTILDVIRSQDRTLLPYVHEKMGYCSTRLFNRDPMMETIFHSGIPHTVYPSFPEQSIDHGYRNLNKELSPGFVKPGEPRMGRINLMLEDANLLGLPYGDTPLIPVVGGSASYIFSEAFYADTEGQSKLEHAVRDFIHNKAIDPRLLVAFCKTCHAWDALARFYLIPIVLVLCNSWIRRL